MSTSLSDAAFESWGWCVPFFLKEHRKNVLRAIGMRCSENITFHMLIVFGLSCGIWLVTVYFAVMCSISAVAAYLSPETYKSDFMGQPDTKAERQERFVRKPAAERVGA